MLRKPEYGRLFFEAETGTGGGNAGTTGTTTTSTTGTPPATGESDAVTFSEAQQKELNRLIGKARTEGRDAEKQAAQEAADAAAAAAQRDADAAKGNYESAKASLESERDAARTERDDLKTENEAITAYFSTQYAAALKELPEVITAFAPAEDASFAVKSDWLTKAQAQAAKLGGDPKPGNGPNPKPGDGKRDLNAAAQKARASGRYTV